MKRSEENPTAIGSIELGERKAVESTDDTVRDSRLCTQEFTGKNYNIAGFADASFVQETLDGRRLDLIRRLLISFVNGKHVVWWSPLLVSIATFNQDVKTDFTSIFVSFIR